MKRAIVWGLLGAILVASLVPQMWGKLSGDLGVGKHAGRLVEVLYVALFAVLGGGYLNAVRGRRHYELRDSSVGELVAVDARPTVGWARARLRFAPDRVCYVVVGGYTALAICAVAAMWAAIAFYSWRATKVWWIVAIVATVGAIQVWSMTRRAVWVCSTHGTEDAFHGSKASIGKLRDQLAGCIEATATSFVSKTLIFESSTVMNVAQATTFERIQETPWALILMGIVAIGGAVAAKAALLGVVGVVFIGLAILIARPHAVARFEGGAELPIPAATFASLDESVSGQAAA